MPTDPHLDVSEAVRVQILATEHWSLLAARNITYGAIYSRATIFLTVVSAAVVALALAAEATEFGDRFYVFALLVLPAAFFIGVGTFIRLVDARIEDFWLLSGLNRLRHAYLEIAPGLEPYFVTGHHDDERGLSETYGPGTENRVLRLIASTSTVVGVIDAVLAGVVGGLVAKAVGAGSELSLLIGAVATSVVVALLVHADRRIIARGRRRLEPRFARSAEAGRMHEQQEPPSSPRADVPQSVRAQILATEHWSLLAARDVTYRAVFSRAAIFLTVVSAGRRCVGPGRSCDRVRRRFHRVCTPRSAGRSLRRGGDIHPPHRSPDRRLLAPVRHESHPSRLSRDLAGARAVFRYGPPRRRAGSVRDVWPRHGEPVLPPDRRDFHARRGDERSSRRGRRGARRKRCGHRIRAEPLHRCSRDDGARRIAGQHEQAPHRTWASVARAPLRTTGRDGTATRVAGRRARWRTSFRSGRATGRAVPVGG